MKTRIVVSLVLIAGLTSVQGCCGGGTWFPKTGKRARKQSSLETKNQCEDARALGDLVGSILDATINN
jgi:hypothetical protein